MVKLFKSESKLLPALVTYPIAALVCSRFLDFDFKPIPFLSFVIVKELFSAILKELYERYVGQAKKDSKYYANLAFHAIRENNLDLLKKHPLWDKESPTCDQPRFRNL